jgi:membrane associated rhomboid family serine protease
MHVVGSVKGHPEMIWSTFEHVSNTPNTNGNTQIATMAGVAADDYLFNDNTGYIAHLGGVFIGIFAGVIIRSLYFKKKKLADYRFN